MNAPRQPAAPRFGLWLRRLRAGRQLPLRGVASAIGLDLALLSKIELGQRLPTEEQTDKLAKFFGLDPRDVHARRIAEKFRQDYAEHPAAGAAIMILAEESATYRTRNGR